MKVIEMKRPKGVRFILQSEGLKDYDFYDVLGWICENSIACVHEPSFEDEMQFLMKDEASIMAFKLQWM